MFKKVNVCYVSMIVVTTKNIAEDSDVVLAAIATLEVRMLVYFSVHNEFHHFAMSVRNEFICSNRLMFVMYLY